MNQKRRRYVKNEHAGIQAMREDYFLILAKLFKLLHFEKVTDPHGNEVQPTCLFCVIVSEINVFLKNLLLPFMLLFKIRVKKLLGLK